MPHRFILSLLLAFGLVSTGPTVKAGESMDVPGIQSYGQTAPGEGWLLIDGRLFRTLNDGADWTDITPRTDQAAEITTVTFINSAWGWAILSGPGDPSRAYTLASTTNFGNSWDYHRLALPELDPFPNAVDSVHMGWRGADLGWLVFKFSTGSNFSLGTLFLTRDGGETWKSRPLPLGEPVSFINTRVGWVAGGPASDQLFRTSDGGFTWEPYQITDGPAITSLPRFNDDLYGLLPLVTHDGKQSTVDIYRTEDGGKTWMLSARIPLGPESPLSSVPVEVLDSRNYVLQVPGQPRMAVSREGESPAYKELSGNEAGIVSLSMSSMESGWAKSISGDCSPSRASLECNTQEKLLTTRDGGGHWEILALPISNPLEESFSVPGKATAASTDSSDPDTQPYLGHGFDACEIPSLSQMQTWWNRSPYNAVNLYIGGSARACANSVLSASYLGQLHSQGWRFIPTWVGPQASCTGYSSRMSSNVVLAYNQGIAEADKALNAAVALGLAAPDKSGTVIYYDLEAYDISDDNCRAAANAFISGWVGRMRELGNLGAAYGASCSSAVTDWNSIANVPDALWIANWYRSSFSNNATVWDAYCLSNSLWSNHQRLRQYAGGHDETWGGLTINIDSNVLDGPLAVPDGSGNLLPPSTPSLRSPGNQTTLARGTNPWLQWKTTGDTCSVHVWGGSIDITSPSSCSQFQPGVQAGGAYSWQVTATNSLGSTTGPVWNYNIRPHAPSSLTASPSSGTRADLTWALSTDDPAGVDGYRIFADGLQVGSVSKGVSTFQVRNLSCLAPHTFHITSIRQSVQSLPSLSAGLTTPSCAPVLKSPLDLAVTKSLRPGFTWNAVTDANSYQIQISSLADFSTLIIDKTVIELKYTPGKDLPANSHFSWRTRARGTFGDGDWSPPFSFTTGNPPSIPLLLKPAPNALLRDLTPLLDWSDSSLPEGTMFDHYQLRISTESRFKTPIYNLSIPLSEYIAPTRLLANTTYYWQIRAFNNLGQYSTWSSRGTFRTALLRPRQLLPENGAAITTLRPLFDWTDVTGASSYTLQISPDHTFSTLLLTAMPLKSDFTPISDLPSGPSLFWRVRSEGPNGPSYWSPTWTFTVQP